MKTNEFMPHDGNYYRIIPYDMDNKLKREITYLQRLGSIEKFKNIIPENLTFQNDSSAYMKEYPNGTLDKTFFYMSESEQLKVLKKILALWNKFQTITPNQLQDNLPLPKKVYIDKYWHYFIKKNLHIETYNNWILNDKSQDDIYNSNTLDKIYNHLEYLSETCVPRIMHGEFYISNMIYSDSNIILIGPRGQFGNGWSLFGDPRLDLAKLRMSIVDIYETFDQGKINFTINKNKVNFNIIDGYVYKSVSDYLDEFISSKYKLSDIILLEAYSIINLIPSYDETYGKIMYCKAVELINNFL